MKKTILLCLIAVLLVGTMVSCIFDFSDKSYKVTYDYGYENKKLICFVLNGSSALPITISRAGYTFNGWYSDEKCNNLYDFTVVLTKSITLYAKWDESAAVLASAGRTGCGWVQLWEGGPKWAEFNVGSTINDYSSATSYSTANVGGLYCWGGSNERREGKNQKDQNTGSTSLSGDSDTATKLWGSNWRMPTKEEMCKLVGADSETGEQLGTPLTSCEWCDGKTDMDVGYDAKKSKQYLPGCTLAGYKVSGIGEFSKYSIFLPCGGCFESQNFVEHLDQTYYWTSSCSDSEPYGVDNGRTFDEYPGNFGYSVRPVLAE